MQNPQSLLPSPLGFRKNIPLYYPKTEAEIKADSYERYNPNVLRSARNFYEAGYGNKLLQHIQENIDLDDLTKIVELGCGSGYLIGNLAALNPNAECVGLDYSYQMLKMADQVFKNPNEKEITLSAFQNGMEDFHIQTQNLNNLSYGLSDACLTPLQDEVVDFCFSCFLWDRVGDPEKLLAEMTRIVKPGGIILIISPFNYLTEKGWKDWHPIDKVKQKISDSGLQFVRKEHFNLSELLDIRGNKVVWEVDSLLFKKPK